MDAYAFDESGLLLTKSRYFLALRDAGVLPAGATTAAFNMRLRDPGVDLTQGGERPADRRSDPPISTRRLASRKPR